MAKTKKPTYITQDHFNKCDTYIKDNELRFKGDSVTVSYDVCIGDVDASAPQVEGVPTVSSDCGDVVNLKNGGELKECFTDTELTWRYTCKEGDCPEGESPWTLVKQEDKESTVYEEGENITIEEVEGDCGEKTITISSIDTNTQVSVTSNDSTITIIETVNAEGEANYDISKVCPPDTNTQNTTTSNDGTVTVVVTDNADGTKNYDLSIPPYVNPCDALDCGPCRCCAFKDGQPVCIDCCDGCNQCDGTQCIPCTEPCDCNIAVSTALTVTEFSGDLTFNSKTTEDPIVYNACGTNMNGTVVVSSDGTYTFTPTNCQEGDIFSFSYCIDQPDCGPCDTVEVTVTGDCPNCVTTCPDPITYCPGEEPADGCGGTCPTGTKDCTVPCDTTSICDIGLIQSDGGMNQTFGPYTHSAACTDPITLYIGFNNLVVTDKLTTKVNGSIVDTSTQATAYFTSGVSNLYNTQVTLQPGDSLDFEVNANAENTSWALAVGCECACFCFNDDFAQGIPCGGSRESCGNKEIVKGHPVCTHPGSFSIGRYSSGSLNDSVSASHTAEPPNGNTGVTGEYITYSTDNGECEIQLIELTECLGGEECVCESQGVDECQVDEDCPSGFSCFSSCSNNVCSKQCFEDTGG